MRRVAFLTLHDPAGFVKRTNELMLSLQPQ